MSRIRRRFAESGLAGLPDRPRSGRPRTVKPRKTAQVVAMTLKPPPAGVTHWSTRDLAKKLGLSHSTVHRIWKAHSLKPHRVETFKGCLSILPVRPCLWQSDRQHSLTPLGSFSSPQVFPVLNFTIRPL